MFQHTSPHCSPPLPAFVSHVTSASIFSEFVPSPFRFVSALGLLLWHSLPPWRSHVKEVMPSFLHLPWVWVLLCCFLVLPERETTAVPSSPPCIFCSVIFIICLMHLTLYFSRDPNIYEIPKVSPLVFWILCYANPVRRLCSWPKFQHWMTIAPCTKG